MADRDLFEQHAPEIARLNDELAAWCARRQEPGCEHEPPPVDLSLSPDEWLEAIAADATRRGRRKTSVERWRVARALVGEHGPDGLWARLLNCYAIYGKRGAVGFLLGSSIPPEHFAAILAALPPASRVRRLLEVAAAR